MYLFRIQQTNTLARPSAPELAMYGFDGWKATSCIDSSNFFRCAVISWTQVLVSKFQKRIEQSWPGMKTHVWLLSFYPKYVYDIGPRNLLPERRNNPLGSIARLVTASKCATIQCTILPLVLSKNLMWRSSCAVIVSGSVGWHINRLTWSFAARCNRKLVIEMMNITLNFWTPFSLNHTRAYNVYRLLTRTFHCSEFSNFQNTVFISQS